jgi:hypothetical protein
LPTPQPSSWLVQATLARAEAKLTEQAEHDWTCRVMIVVVAFAWLLTIASWPVFHVVSGRFGSLLEPRKEAGMSRFTKELRVIPKAAWIVAWFAYLCFTVPLFIFVAPTDPEIGKWPRWG